LERISDLERRYVLEVLDGQFRTSAGSSMTRRLEERFAAVFGCRYAISFINGTATMHAALAAADIGPGDDVIVPPLTMASTAFAVLHAGAVPVFADVDPDTWTIAPASVEAAISPRTRGIIPVAIYGLSPDMDSLMALAARHGLFVLEDDAQCFLGTYKDRIVGSLGHAASFSFQSSKHMTSGEGGMVTTDDAGLAERIRRFNSLGYAAVGAAAGEGKITRETIQDPAYERHESVGWNYRLPELCAAVALGQTERLQELVAARVQAARLYAEAALGCTWLVPQAVPAGYGHAYWTYVLKLESGGAITWHDFRAKYRELGGDGIYAAWQLTYLEPAFQDRPLHRPGAVRPATVPPSHGTTQASGPGLCPVAESLQPRLLQFKTNYWDASGAQRQADVLARTIAYFGR
jgi:perosamine synthetase